MVKDRVSVIIPARNERFLVPTVQDLLSKAQSDIEIIAVLDGYWPQPQLPSDARLKILHRGDAHGMRPAINSAVRMSTGQYLLKTDAHCLFDDGYDAKLKADYHEDNWILTMRRYALDAERWALDTSNSKYPVDYHYLSNPFERIGDPTCGLHGSPWMARREARRDILLDDEMSSQGSAWFMARAHWERLGEMQIEHYGCFVHEFQELGLKTWLGGGAVKVTKRTFYAHLYKGKKYGRGYVLGPNGHKQGSQFVTDYWMHDRYPKAIRPLRWLVEKFWPVPSWPADLDQVFRRSAA